MSRGYKSTDDEMIAALQQLAEELGRTPVSRELRKPHRSAYDARFGSFKTALALAGLEVKPPARIRKKPKKVSLVKSNLTKNPTFNVGAKLRFIVLKRDEFRCQYCGATPQENAILHVGHVVPKSKGGSNDLSNLVTACSICNIGKGASLL